MKIGFVTSSFPRFAEDSAGLFVLEMARALACRGHEIEVVAPGSDVPPKWQGEPAWLSGVRVFEAPYAVRRSCQRLFYGPGAPERLEQNLGHAWLAAPATLSLSAMVRSRSPSWDAVVSHWLVPGGLAVCHGVQGPLPHLSIAHSGDVHLLGKLPGGGALAAQVSRSCGAVGCVSENLAQELSSLLPRDHGALGHRKIRITPMGFDDRFAELAGQRQYRAPGDLTVLCLGRLVPIKGVETLLQAFQGLEGVRLVIAGDGPQRTWLERRACELGVDATFLGFVPPSERLQLLARADIFALPSLELATGRHEGLPLGLVEAMASGLPVIASQTGGVAEIVKHGETGLLTPTGSYEALAKGLRVLIADRRMRAVLGTRAARRVRHRTWSSLALKYEWLLLGGCFEESLLTDAPVNL